MSISQRLDYFYETKRIPHTLFHGSTISDKENIVIGFLKRIYGSESRMSENVMFVNCAHGKGIRFIRDEIKFFAKTNAQPGIWFKSVVLLNADHLTIDAQSALRRCIEQYSTHTRFFIVAENKNKLLTPILSRFCEIFVPDTVQTVSNEKRLSPIDEHLSFCTDRSLQTHTQLMEVATILSEDAFHAGDLVDWVQTRSEWNPTEKANIAMSYAKIKPEYRSEKLLLLTMLSVICNHPNIDLKNMSFM